jgi:hypothetical protein
MRRHSPGSHSSTHGPVARGILKLGVRRGVSGRLALAVLLSCLGLLATASVAAASATIKGKVTNGIAGPEYGDAVQSIEVTAYYAATGEAVSSEQEVDTGPLGTYELTVPSGGEYLIGFNSTFVVPTDFAPQYYPEEAKLVEAKSFVVGESGIKSGINAKLTQGAAISGVVTDADTHRPVPDVAVFAISKVQPSRIANVAVTNTSGEYTLMGLASGPADVAFYSEGLGAGEGRYIPQIYDDQTPLEADFGLADLVLQGTPIEVTIPDTTQGIDAALVLKEPVDTAAPVASGTAAVGQTLSCASGSWTGLAPLAYAHQWLRDGTAIGGANGSTYVVQVADQGHGLSCQETAKNEIASVNATSNTVAVPAAAVIIPPAVVPPVPRVTLSDSKVPVSGSSARVQVSCAGAPCSGSIELTERVLVKQRKGKKAGSKFKIVILGNGSYSLTTGHSATFVVHLTAAGKSTLAKARHHRLSGAILVSVAGGKSAERSPVPIESAPTAHEPARK